MLDTNSILEKEYKVNSLNINTNKKLGLYGLLGILQDAAGAHADKLGFGYEESISQGFFWVLVRQKLRMEKWPAWHDTITVKTWTKPIIGTNAFREYEFYINNEKIGDCSTTWMILDTKTRRPKQIDNTADLFKPRTDYSLNYTAEKVLVPTEIEKINTFNVRISDLDMNNHVNNVKFTQWVLDSIPFTYHKSFEIKEYEINFIREIFLNDKVEVSSNMQMLNPKEQYEIFFKGNRENESKPAFTARILTKAVQ